MAARAARDDEKVLITLQINALLMPYPRMAHPSLCATLGGMRAPVTPRLTVDRVSLRHYGI